MPAQPRYPAYLLAASIACLPGCGGAGDDGSAGQTDGGTGPSGESTASDSGPGNDTGVTGVADGTTTGPITAADTGDSGSDTGSDGGTTGEPQVFVDYDVVASSYIDAPAQGTPRPQMTRDVAFDSQGNVVVVGGTSAANFPTTPGAYDTTFSGPGAGMTGDWGDMDVFVAKFDPAGALLWSTLLGGPSYDRAYAVEIAPNDDVVIAGRAGMGFDTTPGVMQEAFFGDDEINAPYSAQDGFVARISADGSDLAWSSYIGGVGRGFVRDMDIDARGQVYLAMSDVGGALAVTPAVAGPYPDPLGGRDGYYARIASDGSAMLFGTYLGGPSGGTTDFTNPSIRVSRNGDVHMMGYTASPDVACVANDAGQPQNAGGLDLILAKFGAQDALEFCTYFGGSGDEELETHTLAIGQDGAIYLAGGSTSADLPGTATGAMPTKTHGRDGFVARLVSDGSLTASTYLGFPGMTDVINRMDVEGLAVAPNGDIVAGGSTRSGTTTSSHGTIGRLSPDLTELLYLEPYGGSQHNELRAVAVANNGDVLLGGQTTSDDLLTVNAFDADYSVSPELSATYLVLRPRFE